MPFLEWNRGIDAELRADAVAADEIARGFHARRQGIFDVARVADVDVVVDHDHQVEVLERAEAGRDRVALEPVMLGRRLFDGDDHVKTMQAARGHLDVFDDRNRRAQHLHQARLEHVFAQHDGFAPEPVDGVIDRPVATGERRYLDHRRLVARREIADELAEWSLVDARVGADAALEHDLALRRH